MGKQIFARCVVLAFLICWRCNVYYVSNFSQFNEIIIPLKSEQTEQAANEKVNSYYGATSLYFNPML